MKKNLIKNVWMSLLVVGVFFGSYAIGACIAPQEEIGTHEESLQITINGTTGNDNICFVSTNNAAYGLKRWACRYTSSGASFAWDVTNYDHYNVYTDLGNDTVVVRSSDVCSCSCPNIPVATYGAQINFDYPDPGNTSNIFNFRDTPTDPPQGGTDNGKDSYFGGSGRQNYFLTSGTNIARGGKYRDVYSGGVLGDGAGQGTQIYYDPGSELDPDGFDEYYDGGSGKDTIWDLDCVWHVGDCDCGDGVVDVSNCGGCVSCELDANPSAPSCPAAPFPQW